MDRQSRIANAQKMVRELTVDGALFEDPVDIYYFLGIKVSLGTFLVTPDTCILFVDGRYFSSAKQHLSIEIKLLKDFTAFVKSFSKLGFDSSFVSYDRFLQYQEMNPSISWIAISKPSQVLRRIKDKEEISCLRKAQELTRRGLEHVASLLQVGVSEIELRDAFEHFCKKGGAEKLSFDPIIAFGKNSAYPHHRAGHARLEKDSVVLIDVGAVVDGYAGDMTRCEFFGDVDPKLVRDYEILKKAQMKALSIVSPGVCISALDDACREVLKSYGVENLFTHSLGHGIGLETHEPPFFRKEGKDRNLLLQKGMAFTVEPGIYREGLGGTRFEDVVIVTDAGYETI